VDWHLERGQLRGHRAVRDARFDTHWERVGFQKKIGGALRGQGPQLTTSSSCASFPTCQGGHSRSFTILPRAKTKSISECLALALVSTHGFDEVSLVRVSLADELGVVGEYHPPLPLRSLH